MRRLAGVLVAVGLLCGIAAWRDGPTPFGRILMAVGLADLAYDLMPSDGWRGVALYRAGRYEEAAAAFWSAGPDFAFDRGDALARAGHYKQALAAFETAIALHPDDEAATANRALLTALLAEPPPPPLGQVTDGGAATREKKVRASELNGDAEDTKSKGDGMAGDQQAKTQTSSPGGSKVARKGETDTKAEHSGDGKATGSAADSDGVGKSSVTEAAVAQAFEMVKRRELGKSFDQQSMSPSRQWLLTLDDDPGRYLKLRILAEHARRVDAGNALADGGDDD